MSRRLFFVLVAAGALVRIIGLPSRGTPDVLTFSVWTYNAATIGPTQLYGVDATWPPTNPDLRYGSADAYVDYPPVSLYALAVVGRLYKRFDPTFPDSPLLISLLKVPPLLTSIGLLMLILRVVGRRFGADAGRLAAMSYWVNPAIILHGSVLGYLGTMAALPAVAALVAALDGAGIASGALLAVACLTKPQGVLVAPAVAIALLAAPEGARRAIGKAVLSGAAIALLIIWPIIRAGAFLNMVYALGGLVTDGTLSAQAANLWWVVGFLVRSGHHLIETGSLAALREQTQILKMDDLLFPAQRLFGFRLGGVIIFSATWAALGVAVLAAMWRARRVAGDFRVGLALAALTVHLYFVLAVQVHENHLYLALPLLAFLVPADRRYLRLLVLLSAITFLNLSAFYGVGDSVGAWRDLITAFDVTIPLALVDVAALVWHARLFADLCTNRTDHRAALTCDVGNVQASAI
jgi:hypothetical protein